MGCLIQIFFQLLTYFLWYFVLYPSLVFFTYLRKTGLIWSATFYVTTAFFFLDTAIQDYRILITAVLLIPFIIKTFIWIIKVLEKIFTWFENRAEKNELKLQQKEKEVNRFYD
ncbi:MAG: hypothetical protein ACTH80_04495 [Alkalibacterium gilvum]|uniref:hypothetical protein n=1 Tax=Alkalibacterium gilvum TaxID=1130080 RepID=UPI003F8F4645